MEAKHEQPIVSSPAKKRALKHTISNTYTKSSTQQMKEHSAKMRHEANDDNLSSELLHIEDYDAKLDSQFVNEHWSPYLKSLYKDLMMRSSLQKHLDKVTFIEYTKLPGIINDRIHYMFSNYKNSETSQK